jgi:isocitrate/isopropylmalate dehydrogenase
MMLRWSLGADAAADALTVATLGAVAAGVRTADIALEGVPVVTTSKFGDEVVRRIQAG